MDESEFKQRIELQKGECRGEGSNLNVNSDNIGGGRMNVKDALSTVEIVCRGERSRKGRRGRTESVEILEGARAKDYNGRGCA